jgi:hypothetical protein
VSQQGSDGFARVRDLGTFDYGSVLGEMSPLDDLPRTASAVARRSARALRLADHLPLLSAVMRAGEGPPARSPS